jgi:hypothetical protein
VNPVPYNTTNRNLLVKQYKIIRNINKYPINDFLIKLSYETSIPGTTRKKISGGTLSLVSTTEELLDRKVAAPV